MIALDPFEGLAIKMISPNKIKRAHMLRYASLRLNYCVYLRLMESNAKSWAQRKHAFIQEQDFVKSSCETSQLHIILRFSII